MLELGLVLLVLAIAIRVFAGFARLLFQLLLVAGVIFAVLGLLGFEWPALARHLRTFMGG